MIALIGEFQGHLPSGKMADHQGRRWFCRQLDCAQYTDQLEVEGFDGSTVLQHQLEAFAVDVE
jgi:hypothetical protein